MSEVKYMGKRLIFAVGEHVIAFPTDLMDLLSVAAQLDAGELATLAKMSIEKVDNTLPPDVVEALTEFIVKGFAEAKEKAHAKKHNVSEESTGKSE